MNAPISPLSTSDDRSLDALFAPKSVAIIGASSDQRRFGGRPIQYLLEAGFEGGIYPVNPMRDEIQGLKAFKSINDVPGPVDLAMLAVGSDVTQQTVEDCIARGVKAAICYGAGFAEVGGEGEVRQAKLVQTAREGGLRLRAPNFTAHSPRRWKMACPKPDALRSPASLAAMAAICCATCFCGASVCRSG